VTQSLIKRRLRGVEPQPDLYSLIWAPTRPATPPRNYDGKSDEGSRGESLALYSNRESVVSSAPELRRAGEVEHEACPCST